MNLDTIRQTTLDSLISMAKHPGTKDHAWWRAKQLDKDDSGLFTGIAQELKEHMLKLKDEQKSTGA